MTRTNKEFTPIKASTLPTKLADIQALADKATKQGNQSQHNYQVAACAIIQHLGTHKDIRVVRSFIEQMPEGMRADSMTKFFDLYAPVMVDEEGVIHYAEDKKVSLALALEKPWWKAKVAQPYKPFNFIDELEKLYNRSTKRLDSIDPEKGDDLTPADINALRELISAQKQSDLRLVA